MANNTIRRSWNMYSMVNIEDLRGSAFQAEDGGHTFEITGLDASGNATAISGTVAAVFLRPDNTDVAIAGSVSNGKAYVTLTDECYGYPGRFGLTIFLTSGGQKVAIYAAIGSVHRTSSGAVSPETAQDVVDLINEIEAAIALIPSSYTDIMAAIAPTYSNTALYNAGAYAWYEGKLYRCISAITSGESWTSGHWILANIGDNVCDLKSALHKEIGFETEKTLSTISNGKWQIQASGYNMLLSVDPGSDVKFLNQNRTVYYTVLKSLYGINIANSVPDFATGYSGVTVVAMNTAEEITIPNDGRYVWFYGNDPGHSENYYLPTDIYIDGYYASESLIYNINKVASVHIDSPMNARLFFDPLTVTNGYFVAASTGNLVQNSDFRASDYIATSGKKIGISRGVAQFAFYDYSKKYISGVSVASGTHDFTEYNIPDNAKYVRLSLVGSQVFDLQYLYCVFSDGVNCPFVDWIYVDKANAGMCPEFLTIRKAIEFAVKYKNSKVFVRSGTYNLLDEFADEISNSANYQYGLGIGNGIHVFCESGCIINCLYTGSDVHVFDNLSPFYANADDSDFTIENAEIHSSNCRYCVHDELSNYYTLTRHIYKNCRMYHDDRGSGSRLDYYPQCIGGGCGKSTYVDIEGCYFYSKKAESSLTPLVSYHNSIASNARSKIHISDSYFADNGTFQCSFYGTTTLMSEAVVNNCSLGAEPYTTQEGAGGYPENFSLLSFNNEIR